MIYQKSIYNFVYIKVYCIFRKKSDQIPQKSCLTFVGKQSNAGFICVIYNLHCCQIFIVVQQSKGRKISMYNFIRFLCTLYTTFIVKFRKCSFCKFLKNLVKTIETYISQAEFYLILSIEGPDLMNSEIAELLRCSSNTSLVGRFKQERSD